MARSPWLVRTLPKRLKPAGAKLVGHYRAREKAVRAFFASWFPEPKPVAPIPIKDLLHAAQERLLFLQRRQYLLEAIDAEWGRVTRGKWCWFHDDAAFRAIMDVDNMNVIDLCSWGIGTSDSEGSLLPRVRDHHLADLAPDRPPASGESPSLSRALDKAHAEARARVFPRAAGCPLREGDAEDLIARFERQIQPLRDDRNKNRAHAHENKTHGTAEPLEVVEMRAMYKYAREVLNDLGRVSIGTTWAETNVTSNNVKWTAEDMVDVVLLPPWFRRATRCMRRDEIYDALHSDSGPGHFNDKAKLKALADRVGDGAD